MAAMLLLVVAPGVSQYLMASHGMAGMHGQAMCAEHGMAMSHAGHGDHAGMPDGMEHGDACGYCSLLSHTPLTPTIAALPAFTLAMPEPALADVPAQRTAFLWVLHAAPRGPPQAFLG